MGAALQAQAGAGGTGPSRKSPLGRGLSAFEPSEYSAIVGCRVLYVSVRLI